MFSLIIKLKFLSQKCKKYKKSTYWWRSNKTNKIPNWMIKYCTYSWIRINWWRFMCLRIIMAKISKAGFHMDQRRKNICLIFSSNCLPCTKQNKWYVTCPIYSSVTALVLTKRSLWYFFHSYFIWILSKALET